MKIAPKGLYGKLILYVSLVVIATALLSGIIVYAQQTSRIESTAKENVMLMAKNLSLACADYILVRDYATMEQYLTRFSELQNIAEIRVYDKDGAVLSYVIRKSGSSPRSIYGTKHSAIPDAPQPVIKIEDGLMSAVHPIFAGDTILGWVGLKYRLEDMLYFKGTILRNTLLVGIFGIFLSFIALLLVLMPPIKAIRRTADFAKRLDEIKGEAMPVNHAFAEIEQLCEALNHASQKLYASEKALIRHRDNLETQVSERTAELSKANESLQKAYDELKAAQSQLLQSEKMASIGQLAAGVAHEINNPMGFIISNLGSLNKYIDRLQEFINAQGEALNKDNCAGNAAELNEKRKGLKLDYIIEDAGQLLKESLDGAERVEKIVRDLKTFSHIDQAEFKMDDINAGIDTTLNILWNELKYKTTIKKEYGNIPLTKCNLGQLNQVFMNIIVNAAQAIEKHGEIAIKTWEDGKSIFVSISDTGKGIPREHLTRIFEPFFTTKEVGKGTGLGLSIAYDIVKKHNGEISVQSEIGKGTAFTIQIPITK